MAGLYRFCWRDGGMDHQLISLPKLNHWGAHWHCSIMFYPLAQLHAGLEFSIAKSLLTVTSKEGDTPWAKWIEKNEHENSVAPWQVTIVKV